MLLTRAVYGSDGLAGPVVREKRLEPAALVAQSGIAVITITPSSPLPIWRRSSQSTTCGVSCLALLLKAH
eukprot:4860347-Alexandrium_andersonii.AAC.1